MRGTFNGSLLLYGLHVGLAVLVLIFSCLYRVIMLCSELLPGNLTRVAPINNLLAVARPQPGE